MAVSLSQGGSGYPYICKGVYDYLCGKELNEITIDYTIIPDYDIKLLVSKVNKLYDNVIVTCNLRVYSDEIY